MALSEALVFRLAIVFAAVLSAAVVWRLDDTSGEYLATLRSRFLLGVPWATLTVVGFSLEWYTQLLSNEAMMAAIRRSLLLASATMAVTTVLATAMAIAYRREFLGKRTLLFLFVLGIITPGITYGIGATLLLNEILGLPKNLWLALTVHVVWTLPFSFIVLLAGFPPTLAQNERAARVMGADTVTVFREIVFPQISPTILGAAVFAFTLSYNEATRGLLIIGRQNTMPLEVFAIASSRRPTPELFALGSITTVVSTVLLVTASVLVFRSRAWGEDD